MTMGETIGPAPLQNSLGRRNNVSGCGQEYCLQNVRLGRNAILSSDPHYRAVQVIESGRLNGRGDLGGETAQLHGLTDHDAAARLANRAQDSFKIEGHERS